MIKQTGISILIISFLFSPAFSYADDSAAHELSLNELIEEARQNNPEIKAAKARWEAALARVPLAKALESPSVGFTFEKVPGSPFRLNKTASEDRMLSISQAFPLFGKLSLKGKIAFIEAQIAAAEYRNKELEIIEELKHDYHDLFMNYKRTVLNKEVLDILDAVANIVEAKYIAGEVPQEQFFKIILEMAKMTSDIQNLEQEKTAAETRINLLLNRSARLPLGIPGLEESMPFHQDVDSLYKLTLEHQPELSTFAYAIEKNKFEKSLAQRNILPDIMSEIVLRGLTSGSIGPWDVALSFTMPFWFWTKQRYQVKEAIANLDEAKATYQAMQNRAYVNTQDLVTKIEIARNKVNLYKRIQIPLIEGSIESSLSAVRSGKGDLMSLLDTLRMLVETKLSYYNALVDYHMGLTDLEFSVGVDLMQGPNLKEVEK